MKLMVLDGNSLVNRAFFGIKLLTTKDGRYTNAIYGFQNILLNLLAAHKPDAVAIAWDERAPTFRHTAYDATRPPATHARGTGPADAGFEGAADRPWLCAGQQGRLGGRRYSRHAGRSVRGRGRHDAAGYR